MIVISMMWFTYVGGTGIADGVDGAGVRQGDFKGGKEFFKAVRGNKSSQMYMEGYQMF